MGTGRLDRRAALPGRQGLRGWQSATPAAVVSALEANHNGAPAGSLAVAPATSPGALDSNNALALPPSLQVSSIGLSGQGKDAVLDVTFAAPPKMGATIDGRQRTVVRRDGPPLPAGLAIHADGRDRAVDPTADFGARERRHHRREPNGKRAGPHRGQRAARRHRQVHAVPVELGHDDTASRARTAFLRWASSTAPGRSTRRSRPTPASAHTARPRGSRRRRRDRAARRAR